MNALYLEDEVLVGLDGEFLLKGLGFSNVVLFHDLASARKHVEEYVVHFALLDFNLGDGTTSLEFARELRERKVPIAFVSGYTQFSGDLPENAPVAGKPFDKSSIRNLVAKAITVSP